jgi:hypothetical protein
MPKKTKRRRLPKKLREFMPDENGSIKEQPLMVKARDLGTLLYREFLHEESGAKECGKLLMDWVAECYWGRRVESYIPVFHEIWDLLKAGGYNRKNPFVYGDYDYSVWTEPCKTEGRQVIISVCHCACRDDNTFVYIRDSNSSDIFDTFRCVSVWPRQTMSRYSKQHKFGDKRDIGKPSLSTYRKVDWHWGYYDCRDKGSVFLYNAFGNRVEHASWASEEIHWALWPLNNLLDELQEGSS